MNWKQLAKRISYWTVPPGLQAFIQRQRLYRSSGLLLTPIMQAEFARNKKFHNIHQGQRCFLLGSGPSINKQDLRPLKNEICFSMSLFFLHKDIKEIAPRYHVDAPNHPPYGFEVIQRVFKGFEKSYTERTTYFFGHTPYKYAVFNFLEQNPQFKKDNIYYLNYCYAQTLDETNYKNPQVWDICQPLFSVRSVLYCAIQVAVYMGFQQIYLLGCDHDSLLDFNRGKTAHFYKDEEGIDDSSLWLSREEFFRVYYLRWKQYRLMQEYLTTRGCYIYNATEGGLLDVFPRVTLAEVLAGSQEKRNSNGNG